MPRKKREVGSLRLHVAPPGSKLVRAGESFTFPNGDVLVNDGPDTIAVLTNRRVKSMGRRGASVRINPGEDHGPR